MPAAAAWAVLGVSLGALPVARPALVLTAGYAACYGLAEVTGRLWPPAPGTRWQVPQAMVAGVPPWRRILVWGSILGPGFLTRNPYAGFGLLPLAVGAAGNARSAVALAVTAGCAHAAGRALALLRDARPRRAGTDPLGLVLTSMRWRTADGVLLLAVAAFATAACAHVVT